MEELSYRYWCWTLKKPWGYATIEVEKGSKPKVIDAGVVKFKENRVKDRIKELIEGLDNILKNRVDEVVIEDIFLAYNPRSVLKLAQFRGAIIMKIVTDMEIIVNTLL